MFEKLYNRDGFFYIAGRLGVFVAEPMELTVGDQQIVLVYANTPPTF